MKVFDKIDLHLQNAEIKWRSFWSFIATKRQKKAVKCLVNTF